MTDSPNRGIERKRAVVASVVVMFVTILAGSGCSQQHESWLPPSELDRASTFQLVFYFRAAEEASDQYADRLIFVGSKRAVNNLKMVLAGEPGDFSAAQDKKPEFEIFISSTPPESTTEPTVILAGTAAVSKFIAQAAPQPDALFIIDTGMQMEAPWADALTGWTRTSRHDPVMVRLSR